MKFCERKSGEKAANKGDKSNINWKKEKKIKAEQENG